MVYVHTLQFKFDVYIEDSCQLNPHCSPQNAVFKGCEQTKEDVMLQISKIPISRIAVFILFLPISAYAHHPEISAEAICDDIHGGYVVNYSSQAWSGCSVSSCMNDQVDILINNVVVASSAYSDPDYAFSGTHPAPVGSQPGDVVQVTALAVGDWGNGYGGGQSSSVNIVIPDQECAQVGTGRFTGGGHQIRVDGVRVTRGLTLHCDLLLSNNLEVNWQGNQFHMLEHMTTVACTDDPDIIQDPPPAPLDTMTGVGHGRFNNQEGYTIEFTLVDAGEPGRLVDMASFLIYETTNPANVVLDVPLQYLTGGNLQAHYDQPHK